MARLYVCPRCGPPAKRLPSRMDLEDVRRFCLLCSVATGKLVRLTCPSREKARAKDQEKAKEKAAAARATKAREWTLDDGTDMRRALRKARKFKVWREALGGPAGVSAALRVERAKVDILLGDPSGNHGRAWGSQRAHVHVCRNSRGDFATLLLLHELTHIAMSGTDYVKSMASRKRRPHGRAFQVTLLEAALETWPELRPLERGILKLYKAGGGSGVAYSMDRSLEKVLRSLHA